MSRYGQKREIYDWNTPPALVFKALGACFFLDGLKNQTELLERTIKYFPRFSNAVLGQEYNWDDVKYDKKSVELTANRLYDRADKGKREDENKGNLYFKSVKVAYDILFPKREPKKSTPVLPFTPKEILEVRKMLAKFRTGA